MTLLHAAVLLGKKVKICSISYAEKNGLDILKEFPTAKEAFAWSKAENIKIMTNKSDLL